MRWLIASLLLFTQVSLAQTDEQLLQTMQPDQQNNYQGSFIYERRDVFSTHRMWRFTDAEGQRLERFLQLNGPYLEILRRNGRVSCVLQEQAGHFAAKNWPAQNLDWQQLSNKYQVRFLGESRVANRKTLAVFFEPQDEHRYALELHLDEQTAVPLQSLLINEQGQLLERFQFVDFVPGEVTQQDLQPVNKQQCEQLQQAQAQPLTYDWHWQLGWLPEGFNLVQDRTQNWLAVDKQVSAQTYSDGLSQFSVFVEALGEQQVADALIQMGPTVVVSRRLQSPQGVFMLTVLGEIPPPTAERLLRAIELRGED